MQYYEIVFRGVISPLVRQKKGGSAYKHLLLLLPFQSDIENVATCLL